MASVIIFAFLFCCCSLCTKVILTFSLPIRKENEVELQQAEMRMVRWMCGMKLQDRVPSKGSVCPVVQSIVPLQNDVRRQSLHPVVFQSDLYSWESDTVSNAIINYRCKTLPNILYKIYVKYAGRPGHVRTADRQPCVALINMNKTGNNNRNNLIYCKNNLNLK